MGGVLEEIRGGQEVSDFIDCQNCGVTIHRLYETFPGNICLVCHAQEEEKKPLPTAQQIRQMWGM